jgi:hypothetical protein
VTPLAVSCLAVDHRGGKSSGAQNGDRTMPSYSPELVQTMRAALDEVMTKVPVEQATVGFKLQMAEFILKAAAQGQTDYEGLLNAASGQLQIVLSQLI